MAEGGDLLGWRAEAWQHADQDRVGSRGHGGLGRGASLPRPLEIVGGVAAGDRVQGIVDRPLHHGERARDLDASPARPPRRPSPPSRST